ncbi:MAG: DUF302 domain-containing protein [Candidatus Bathyarchaeota archaeon]|nr:MAG: DUF302 domain-containing protein [Candidatus Bathyarchaeota archaeon]
MVHVLKKEVMVGFDEAVERLEQIIEEQGFSIFLTKSIDDILKKKLQLEGYPRYTIILVCAAELAKMALDVSKDVGTLFPCSFVVYEDDNKVFISHLSIMKTAVELGLAPENQMVSVTKKTQEKVRAVWSRF